MSYFNSVGHVNLFLNIACIMNGVTKKQRLTKQSKNIIICQKITKQSKQNSYTSLEVIFLK